MIMPAKKENTDLLSKKTYQELEEESDKVLEKLSDDSLPLDDRASLYDYGKKIYAEMEKRLDELQKKVSDNVIKN